MFLPVAFVFLPLLSSPTGRLLFHQAAAAYSVQEGSAESASGALPGGEHGGAAGSPEADEALTRRARYLAAAAR